MIDNTEDKKYFHDALDLFFETQWLYKYPVTELLVNNCLDDFPDGWSLALRDLNNEDLNEFVVNKITKRDWPESLLSFVKNCVHLDELRPISVNEDPEILPKSFTTGLNKKKQHEILHFARLINFHCEKEKISTIVDLGAGLGYVCQLLNFLYDYTVLGLESNPVNVEAAKRRQREFYPSSTKRVNYVCTKIGFNSEAEIENLLKQLEYEENFCLIGLHACGDLGVDACKLFSKIPSAKILILLSCCYHKMEIDVKKNRFRNFPVSKTLKTILESSDCNYNEVLNRPFLRLACQEPAVRWASMSESTHREHAFHVLARALLESFTREYLIELKKRVRKATRKSQCTDFQTYLEDTMLRYEFTSKNGLPIDQRKFKENISSSWVEVSERLEETELYTGLQLMMQAPAESFILRDRCCFLRELGLETEIIPVMSRALSPRSHALVSTKKV